MGKRKPRNKALKRSHLKAYAGSAVHTPKQANREFLQELQGRTVSMKTAEKILPQSKYTAPIGMALKPSDFVFKKLMDLFADDFWEGTIDFGRKNLIVTQDRVLYMFFSGRKHFFVAEYPLTTEAVDEDGISLFDKNGDLRRRKDGKPWGYVKRSLVYFTRDIADAAYREGRIQWIDQRALREPLLDGIPNLNMVRKLV